jgi:hypothetical protein
MHAWTRTYVNRKMHTYELATPIVRVLIIN